MTSIVALLIVNTMALVAAIVFAVRHYQKEEPSAPRFFLRTGEGLYLTPQGLRRGAFNKRGDVVAPAYDAISWQTAAEAEEEKAVYYRLNSTSASTISKVSLYVEKEGEAK